MKGIACLLLILCKVASGQTSPFSDRLYPILKNAGCPNCHNSNGVASATRLHFPDASASTERTEAFGRSLVRFVDEEHPGESLLLKKPTMRMPHAGGERIQPGSPEEATLISWIRFLSAMPADERTTALKYDEAGPAAEMREGAVLRRLTNSQYNNTVRDLLGDQTRIADQFPPEDFVSRVSRTSTTHKICPPCSKKRTAQPPRNWPRMRFVVVTRIILSRAFPVRHAGTSLSESLA